MIIPLIAQVDMGSLKAEFLKSMFIFGVGLALVFAIVATAAIAWLQYRQDKKSSKETKSVHVLPNPVEVSKVSKRYNHDATDRRFQSVEDKVKDHGEKITDLEKKVAVEIPEMERRLNEAGEDRSGKIHDRINEILGAVSELRGEMKHRS